MSGQRRYTMGGRTVCLSEADLAAVGRSDDGRPNAVRELEAVRRKLADRDQREATAAAVRVGLARG